MDQAPLTNPADQPEHEPKDAEWEDENGEQSEPTA